MKRVMVLVVAVGGLLPTLPVVALMLPYTLITMIVWILVFLAWYWLGLPWGPV